MPKRVDAQRVWAPALCCLALLGLVQNTSLAERLGFDTLRQLAATRYGPEAVDTIGDWEQFVAGNMQSPLPDRLQRTNDFFNQRLRWSSDEQIYGVEDHWATPLESLSLGAADCEDFSIAKYITLLTLGVDPSSLRLIYVKARRPGGITQAHMVLAWYSSSGAEPLILDNITSAVVPARQRQDLIPIFSFNADDLWISGAAEPSDASPRLRLSRWRQVLERIVDEGFSANW
jgi:predicted transglutaminase-like cysteine proteinase